MFYATKKDRQIFEVNRKNRSLSKLCSVTGLAPLVFDVRFTEYMNFLESIVSELRIENMEHGVDSTDLIDLPESFDSSWCISYSRSFISSY